MALLHVDFYSDTLGMCVEMDVILPENTQGQIGMEGRAGDTYPTLYLLHGMSDDHTIWQRRTSIERYVSDMNLAVVMPSTQLGWYTDMNVGPEFFTYIAKELPEVCRKFFPRMSKKREDTFVAGLSMGGYGALKCGLCAPETFSYAASLSGAVDLNQTLATRTPEKDDGYNSYYMDIFGPFEKFTRSENDLMFRAKQLAESGQEKPHVYLWCGTEDFLYKQNISANEQLKALGYDVTCEFSAGDHQWKYWDEKIQRVLQWLPAGK